MSNERFVYIPALADTLEDDDDFACLHHVPAWLVMRDCANSTVIYAPESKRSIEGKTFRLFYEEEISAIDADETNTPDEAWAALAKWRLSE